MSIWTIIAVTIALYAAPVTKKGTIVTENDTREGA
jgi:hypothetical protein